ncbi:FxsB family cyclophane-forming radical SAM/SPASM peptide maturase [Streptomyces sp. NPDC006684]|uniref:FxsB family cyclophane-forming radical SAM/SPASM peptide maturase n=1 Tax=Streptomyces sp. NPDC006684 TaxID=3154477 RepID=UPI003456AF2D
MRATTPSAPGHGHRDGSGGAGEPPYPFRQFILKTHSRCNLACRYCYLYEGPDTSWRARPATASPEVRAHTARRIGEHAAAHALPAVSLVLHGGEPLLGGAGPLAALAEQVRAAVPAGCEVHVTVQTNGTLLSEAALRTLGAAGIRVGLSLDGGRAAHNRQRVDHAGRPSFRAARGAARLLAAHPDAYAGILTVVDPLTDPVELYTSLLALGPPALDLLLPHGNWSSPPPGIDAARGPDGGPTPYADWLCAVFDAWWQAPRRTTRIRLFEECLALLLGRPAATESLGLEPFTAVVVETDGAIEQVDSLKSAYEGAAATGLDVFAHSFDTALGHPGVRARQSGAAALAAECRACPLLSVCGGGHYAHRYREGGGFAHPSVYCADLKKFIRHVAVALDRAARGAPGEPRPAPAPGASR